MGSAAVAHGVIGTQSCEIGSVDLVPVGHCAQTASLVAVPSVKILPIVHFVNAVQVSASLVVLKPAVQAVHVLSVVALPGFETIVPGGQVLSALQLVWFGSSL